jgi:hypothetical protein
MDALMAGSTNFSSNGLSMVIIFFNKILT